MSGFTSRLSLTHIYVSKYNDKALLIGPQDKGCGTASVHVANTLYSLQKEYFTLKAPEIVPEPCYPSDSG